MYSGETKKTLKIGVASTNKLYKRHQEGDCGECPPHQPQHQMGESIKWERAWINRTADVFWKKRPLEALQISSKCTMYFDCVLYFYSHANISLTAISDHSLLLDFSALFNITFRGDSYFAILLYAYMYKLR